jgi:hypothetical protein
MRQEASILDGNNEIQVEISLIEDCTARLAEHCEEKIGIEYFPFAIPQARNERRLLPSLQIPYPYTGPSTK